MTTMTLIYRPFYRSTQVKQHQNVSILDFIGAKDDAGGGNNWSYKMSSQIITINKPTPIFTSKMPLLSPIQQSNSTKEENNIDFKKYYLKMVTIYILEIVRWLAITISVLRAFFFATISPNDSQTIQPPVFHIRFWYLRCCGCPRLRGRQHQCFTTIWLSW